MRLLVATRSEHKLAEIREILSDLAGVEVVGLDDVGIEYEAAEDDLEPYATFEENASSKARYFRDRSGLPTVSDDSGIEVDALDGAPGVHSKRFAPPSDEVSDRDQANNLHLLRLLDGVEDPARTARYQCVAVFIDGDSRPWTFRGAVEGRIQRAPEGDGGFGYDPLFFVPDLGRTFGRSSNEEKHRLSHRGRAFRALGGHLRTGASE